MLFFIIAPFGFAQSFLVEPVRGYNTAGTSTPIKLFFGSSDSIIFQWSKDLSGRNAKLKIGTQPGNYGDASIDVSGRRKAIVAGVAPLNLPVGRYYAVITNASGTTLSAIQSQYSANPTGVDYSNEIQFVVEAKTVPNPTAPRGTVTSSTPSFAWNSITGVNAYWIICSSTPFQLKSDSLGNVSVQGANIVWDYITTALNARYGQISPTSPFTSSALPLFAGNTYYYTVLNMYDNTNVAYASTVFGGIVSFTYSATQTVSPPNLQSPTDNISLQSVSTIRFQWDPVQNANSYTLYLFNRVTQFAGSNQEIDLPVYNTTVTNTIVDFAARQNLSKGKYSWFVVPNTSTGAGSASATRVFRYETPTGKFRAQAFSALDSLNLLGFDFTIASTTGGFAPSVPFIVSNSASISDSLPVDVYRFTGRKQGYFDTTITVSINSSGTTQVLFYMRPYPSAVSGTVRDQAGAAVSEAKVQFRNNSNNLQYNATTTSTGTFSVNIPKGSYTLDLSKPSYLSPASRQIIIDTGQVNLTNLVLTLDNAIISGKVVNDANEPVQLASVKATKGSVVQEVTTNELGEFSFTLSSGSWVIEVSKSGFSSPAPKTYSLATNDNLRNQVFILIPRANQVTGFVYQSVTGTNGQVSQVPFADITVTATPTNGQTVTAQSNAAGQFTMSLKSGSFTISAAKQGYTSSAATQLTVTVAQTISGINFTLTPNPSSVTGTVTDAAGAALPGAVISVAGVSSAQSVSVGTYTLSLPSGTHTVTVSKTGYIAPQPVTLTLQPGQTLAGINFSLSPNASVISGVVTSLGQPLPQARVTAISGSTQFSAQTNAQGEYLISLPAGSWSVTAAKSGFLTGAPLTVALGPGQSNSNANFSLTENTAQFTGTILGAGQPLSGATVTFRDTANATVSSATVTSISGDYAITLEAGKVYRMTATKTGYSTATATSALTVAGAAYVLNGSVTANPSSVSGTVRSGSNQLGLTGVLVQLVNTATGNVIDTVSTDFNGNYTLGAAAGTYKVKVSRPGYTRDSLTVTLALGQNVTSINFSVNENFAVLTGSFKEASGTAIQSALVNLSGAGNATISTGADGGFTITGLIGGRYSVRFTKTGYADTTVANVVLNDGQSATLNVVGKKLTAKISGTVTASSTPVAGATVTAISSLGVQFTTLTAANGTYEIPGLNTGTYTVTASRTGFTSSQSVNVTLTLSSLNGTANITDLVANNAKVYGTIKDNQNNPVLNATVVVAGTLGSNTASTTTTGEYRIINLAPGSYTVTVSKQGYGTVQVPVTVTDSSNISPVLALNNSTITGTVKNQSGAALGFIVTLKAVTGQTLYSATTDANGSFSIPDVAANASYVLYSEIFREGHLNDTARFTIAAGRATFGPVNIVVKVNTSIISGTVGTSAASVKVTNTANGSFKTASSSSDGSYKVDFLANGSYTVSVSKQGFVFTPASQSVTLGVNETKTVSFNGTASVGNIEITAKTAAGAGVSDAVVSVVSTDTTVVLSQSTGANGLATFTGVKATGYVVRVTKDGYSVAPELRNITVINQGLANETFTLTANTSILGGTIRGKRGTDSIKLADAVITLRNNATGQLLSGRTAADGGYGFNPIPAGTYSLTASKAGFQNLTRDIVIAQGETKTGFDLTLGASSVELRGKVFSGTTPVPNVTVTATSVQSIVAVTDNTGEFAISYLPVNTGATDTTVYDLSISGTDITTQRKVLRIPSTLLGQQVIAPSFALPAGRIRLLITDGTNPLSNVTVSFFTPDGQSSQTVTTSSGLFTSSAKLDSGTYRFGIQREGYLSPDETDKVITLATPSQQVEKTLALRFTHSPITVVNADTAAGATININGATTGLTASLYYRKTSASVFTEVPMSLSGNKFSGSIPAQFSIDKLTYYVAVKEGSKTYRSDEVTVTPGARGILSAMLLTPELANNVLRKGDLYELKLIARDGINQELTSLFKGSGAAGSLRWSVTGPGTADLIFPVAGDSSVVDLRANAAGQYKLTVTGSLRGTILRQTADLIVADIPIRSVEVSAPNDKLLNKASGLQLNFGGKDTLNRKVTYGNTLSFTVYPVSAASVSSSGFFKPLDSTFIGNVTVTAIDSISGLKGTTDIKLFAQITPQSNLTLNNGEGMTIRISAGSVNSPINVTLDKPFFGPGKRNYSPLVQGGATYVVSNKQYFLAYFGGSLLGDSLLRSAVMVLPLDRSLDFFDGNKTIGYYNADLNEWQIITSENSSIPKPVDGAGINAAGLQSSFVNRFGEYSVLTQNEPLGVKYLKVLPSPFSPDVAPLKIGYFLSTTRPPASVTIKIYNMRGELVRTLLKDDLQNPGRYGGRTSLKEIQWNGLTDDGTKALNGRYIIQVNARDSGGEVNEIIPVVLVK